MRRYGLPKMVLPVAAFTLALIGASSVHAQSWSTANSSLSAFPSSVKVGCGTAVPVGQLDVTSQVSNRIALIVNQQFSTGNIAEFRQGTTPAAGAPKVVILNSGNVGIGTTAPSEKLQIVGNALLSGSLRADGGIKIKSNWSMEVPDYVFDETRFKLRGLDDLETFVRKNRHLPDVPSAGELQRDGMDVATMNLTLLKKVEELTLYVIAQDKKIEELSARVGGGKSAKSRARR